MAVKKVFVDYLGKLSEIQTADKINPSNLGSGTADSTTYLRGDNTWVVITGGTTRSINNVSGGNVTAGSTANVDYVYYVSDGSQITLPTAVGNTNRYTIIRTGSSIVPIATTASQTINGATAPLNLITQYTSVDLMSNGSNWFIH